MERPMPYISQPNPPRLDHAAAPGRYLAATCDCGDEQPLDARPWLDQGQGWRRLTELETRLRCLCGARSVRLAIRDGEPPAIASRRIFIFR